MKINDPNKISTEIEAASEFAHEKYILEAAKKLNKKISKKILL